MTTEENKENERYEDSPELESASFSSSARGEVGHNLSGREPGEMSCRMRAGTLCVEGDSRRISLGRASPASFGLCWILACRCTNSSNSSTCGFPPLVPLTPGCYFFHDYSPVFIASRTPTKLIRGSIVRHLGTAHPLASSKREGPFGALELTFPPEHRHFAWIHEPN